MSDDFRSEWDRQFADLPDVIKKPCGECPWVRGCTPGWLGPYPPEEWVALAHSDQPIACHRTITEDESWDGTRQCAGVAIFRSNVFKSPRHPAVKVLPSDTELVFGNNAEFIEHHGG